MRRVEAHEIELPSGPVRLPGTLAMPMDGFATVIFAHGSGSSRLSPRNKQVAETLNQAGLGTLLFDLLTPSEAADRKNVFDIPLLADRLAAATTWFRAQPEGGEAAVGYFGASTGAAAALWAAADLGSAIGAVVSRGGRPDLAGPRLSDVSAPTLLVVGGDDRQVLELNQQAGRSLRCESDLVVLPGASHLFEEAGALEEVARVATDWFTRYLADAEPTKPRRH
jgi:putative phosphoribosyl transferase